MASAMVSKHTVPYRQIRTVFDDETIAVYPTYSASIAIAAVEQQKLNAWPDFKLGRMTWIKPSWCWMMYGSGYSFRDKNQSHILAIKMTHAKFFKLLSEAAVCHGQALSSEDRRKDIRAQWDPERDPALGAYPYRSIQIGSRERWRSGGVEEGIVGIQDVTERARGLFEAVEEGKRKGEKVTMDECVEKGLAPMEREFVVSEELRKILKMEEQ